MDLAKGVKKYQKRNADSTAVYYYWRATGERLPDPEKEPAQFAAAIARCAAGANTPKPRTARAARESGTLGALLLERQRSPHYRELAASTRRMYEYDFKRLETLTPDIMDMGLEQFDRRWIRQLRDMIAATAPGYANRIVMALGALFAFAIENDHPLAANPTHGIKAIPGGSHTRWTDAQLGFALHNLPERFKRGVLLCAYTGQRGGDVAAMKWSQYEGAHIRLRQEKTGEPLLLPVLPPLKVALDRWKRETKTNAVQALTILTTADGRPWRNKASFLDSMAHAFRRHEELGGLTVHGLRHTFAAMAAEAGTTTQEIKAWTGHRSDKMVSLYTKQADQSRLAFAAADRIAARFAKADR